MDRVDLLVTVPELDGEKELLAEIAAVSDRVRLSQRTCRSYAEAAAALNMGVEVLYTQFLPAHLAEADRLKWVQVHSTGVDAKGGSPVLDPASPIIVTNTAGAQATGIAEYCLSAMSMLSRGFLQLFRDQRERVVDRRHSPPVELWGRTVGILGYGHIGREVARLAEAHRMRVLALKNNPEDRKARGYLWPGTGDPEGVIPERIYGLDKLLELLRKCDFVVCCLPSTPRTKAMIDERALRAMKETACLVNVGRGAVVDDAALVAALRERRIAGAALDVFATDPSPLPHDHPFWDLDNLFISPHISGTRQNRQYLERTNQLFCENLRRYVANEPLLNVVDKAAGY